MDALVERRVAQGDVGPQAGERLVERRLATLVDARLIRPCEQELGYAVLGQ
ncbi:MULTISPECIES: hypothetical protein [unclassified Streptomyces]|uniref:hypothetical protein n=1 Tax=unclassified Streptomyces TaxID=2593676 RepID=UPI002258827D|nr:MULTISPECIES: hypothetical protein [unclassified Streptomyces]MCX4798381.1 hypothetical protein [Streptomyces sp. NBC_01242]WSP60374.1 hypothetical protein OG306_07525 [Streptomyces sp. NBC_01241]WSP67690.1 hypothetical protein OG466_31495 [Streptomyces sp. NBC_01240]WSU26761.1 hypothetical protein OG508_31810 [Streptomyces sp. NBC_01108]